MKRFSFELDEFQIQAIEQVEAGRSALVCAPTGTGKTVIADCMVADALEQGRQVIYTAPVKALSNQKYRDYRRAHGDANVGLVTGDLVIRREAPCLVMTTEILRNMLLTGDCPPALKHVVLDEIHFLDDPERGTTWEEVLIYLPEQVQILGLSATMSNLEQFAAWLGQVRGRAPAVIREERRAVPLQLHLFDAHGGLQDSDDFERSWQTWKKKRKAERKAERAARRRAGRRPRQERPRREPPTRHGQVFERLRKQHTPYLYFVFNRRLAELFAATLSRRRPRLLDGQAWRQSRTLLDEFEAAHGTGVLEPYLRNMYEQGVGFHHAGLHVQLKTLVERLYERKLIRVLYCTSTFALGINMPARTVVFDGLRKFDGRAVVPLTVREFMQMAGRAGRRGMDELGHVVVRMDPWDYGELRGKMTAYRQGSPERIQSSFNLSFHSTVNLLDRHPIDRIRQLVQSSFLAFQLAQRGEGRQSSMRHLEQSIRRDMGLQADEPLPPTQALPPPLRKRARQLRRLARQQSESGQRCWADFQQRVSYQQQVGYLGPDLDFQAGAKALLHVQISEIFVVELFLRGVFHELEPQQLFGLLCALVQELPRAASPRFSLDAPTRQLAKQVSALRFSQVVRGAERITGAQVSWSPDLIPFGCAWANGDSLEDILLLADSETDIAGDLVGSFRRARDLLAQLVALWSDDPGHQERLRDLLRATARDEVQVVG